MVPNHRLPAPHVWSWLMTLRVSQICVLPMLFLFHLPAGIYCYYPLLQSAALIQRSTSRLYVNMLISMYHFPCDKSKTVEYWITKFGTHGVLEAPRSMIYFGSKRSKVSVTGLERHLTSSHEVRWRYGHGTGTILYNVLSAVVTCHLLHRCLTYSVSYFNPLGGFLTAEFIKRINGFSRRLKRFGYTRCNNLIW